jgi:hypothetical protein
MRKLLIAVILAATVFSFAGQKPQETIDQLQARAAAAEKKKQVDLYAELAQRQLEAADATYNSNIEQAKALFKEAAQSAVLAAQAAISANHKLKRTEIRLRELSLHMSNIRQTWAFEDRAPLTTAIQSVEAARTQLLNRMFQK